MDIQTIMYHQCFTITFFLRKENLAPPSFLNFFFEIFTYLIVGVFWRHCNEFMTKLVNFPPRIRKILMLPSKQDGRNSFL